MPTATELLTEIRPAWGAALGGRVSPEYLAAFIGRHQRRLESALEPIAAVLAAVPTVNVYELAEDVARRLRGLSEIANALANTPDTFGIELDLQLPKVMLEYLPTVAGGQSQGAGAPERWAIYRRWSDDSAFRRKLREQVYELLWDRRPGWSTSDAAEIEEARAEKEKEARTQLQSTRLRNAAAKLAERRVKVAADSIALLRRQDVERVLKETPSAERRQVAYVLGERRPELVDEIDEVMREVLGEPANWSTYGRDEIYQPGSRERREAALAENATEVEAPVAPIWRSSEAIVVDAAEPSIDEAERELAALAAEDGKPRPVVMASLEAGGIILLHPHSYLGGDLFQTYRDATSKLQYVSYPKKGQRGVPSKVARAVLALERDGFEVRAEDPEVIKSLIVSGGLDHALAVGPPPPREAVARPNTRTSDPALIARVEAMSADPPTSTVKYLAKVLRLNGNLPLQVIDWKNGGKRTLESALEEGEAKVARKLARRPKAERLRDDGVERPARNANEEHAAQALVQLADMDPDKAHEVNEAGFSKSDVNTGHTLARRWEATGELTGDEWAWAVEVANKYRRQVGPLPEPKSKPKGKRSKASDAGAAERLFIGIMPTGISYADRSREVDGDYARCAFLPFDTLALKVAPKCPTDLLGMIEADAAAIIARRGEQFSISTSGHTVVLGHGLLDTDRIPDSPISNGTRDMAQRIVNAEKNFIELVQEQGFTRDEAIKAMAMMLRTKLAVLDAVNGVIKVKHGAAWDPGVIRNAVDAWVEAKPKKERVSKPDKPAVMNYAGDSLATIHDVVSSLKRILGKIYEGYKLNIGASRSIGDNSVMLSFYRVPPDASDLDASNAKSKVRIVIHGEGRTNSPTWPTDQTPERLTAYTVWEYNAPKLRKRSGPPNVIVAAVANWFVGNAAELTGAASSKRPRAAPSGSRRTSGSRRMSAVTAACMTPRRTVR